MPWEITHQAETGIIWAKTFGPMDFNSLNQVGVEIFATGNIHNASKFLVDHREMMPHITLADVHRMPGLLETFGLTYGSRVAVILNHPPLTSNPFKFFETILINRGFNVRVFTTPEDGVAWLSKDD